MKVIVGLGNIGDKYLKTRHNVGFRVADVLAEKLGLSFKDSTKLLSKTAKNTDFILVKPQTFMNESGRAVRAVCDYFQIDPEEDLVVIHDDLDVILGAKKNQKGVGPKVHNGLASIYQHLGTKNFIHLRVGIDGRDGNRNIPGSDYVLSSFRPEEEKTLEVVIEQVAQDLLH
ncbi:MAG: aminoacyl-tRNA hydrolase [Candidatus Pacebacteria bacterium]|jgi:peptidyl-tRNA hydrolase, PTH1 family|nr:aminoacyl-tRNA hydrolase [Candidatus Paceibacterota bacterium]MBT4652581.1 aminoacyl-tRNA hydrolase [Candidatus Paceibacterota bacterium]MBT6756408.1 aminoacyl-tRNA hydrolase [Candidatus Paceibacterota bacterium]MBT6921298.1 aminoacyl-tRNA hydrolase [Candidatus Paceibacterota bacterium]